MKTADIKVGMHVAVKAGGSVLEGYVLGHGWCEKRFARNAAERFYWHEKGSMIAVAREPYTYRKEDAISWDPDAVRPAAILSTWEAHQEAERKKAESYERTRRENGQRLMAEQARLSAVSADLNALGVNHSRDGWQRVVLYMDQAEALVRRLRGSP